MLVEDARKQLKGTKVHAVAIQKGGTGKTTITSDLCFTMAKMGYKVLAIDSDPQASLSSLCNVDIVNKEIAGLQNVYQRYIDALKEFRLVSFEELKDIIVTPQYKSPVPRKLEYEMKPFGFDLIPANIILANYDLVLNHIEDEIDGETDRIKIFKERIKKTSGQTLLFLINIIKQNTDYDYIFIDTCPGLNMLAYNAISASVDGVIVPINLEPMTINGAENLINTTTQIQKALQPSGTVHKGILGVIKNQYAPRLKIQKRFDDVVETFFPIPSFETTVPSKTSCDIAHDEGRLYSEYDSKIGKVFKQLAEEIISEDIRRAEEKETVLVQEFGKNVWDAVNKNK